MMAVRSADIGFRREEGVALVIATLCMLLLTALGLALVLATSSETLIAGNYRNSQEAAYAADAVLERVMGDLLTISDWNQLLNGAAQSAFVDGPPGGTRTLADHSMLDLTEVTNMANCHHSATCSAAELDAASLPDRPWGRNNPRWTLYAYGRLDDLLPQRPIGSPCYVVAFVADDPSENDNDPLRDGSAPCGAGGVPSGDPPSCNPGSGVIAVRAEAFGPRGTHKVIEMTVARTDTTPLERGYAGQRGQDEQGRRSRATTIQSPGAALTHVEADVISGAAR